MSNKVFVKSILRKPFKLLVWALLILVIGFAFAAKMTEYLVVRGEIERIGSYYRAIGTITQSGKQPWEADDNTPVADYIESLDTVAYGQHHRCVPAELVGMQNTDTDGFSFSWREGFPSQESGVYGNNIYLYGTLAVSNKISNNMDDGTNMYCIVLDVDKVEAGHEEYVHVGDRVTAYYYETEDTPASEQFEKGQRYFIRAYFDPFELGTNELKDHLMLGKLDSERWAIPVDADEELDFSSPENAYIGENIDATRFNCKAVSLDGTKDMSALPAFQLSIRSDYMTDGRLLNLEDTLEERRVCVMHQGLAELRGFEIGDTITLNLRDFVSEDGYITMDNTDWKSSTLDTMTFEIVGLYVTNGTHASGYTNDIYIPESCIPSGYEIWNEPFYGYSFVLNSVRDKEDFMAQQYPIIRNMGFNLSFVPDNSGNFLKSADPMIQSAMVGAVIFGVVALIGLMLTVFVYTRMQRENFAIMRALGIHKRGAIVGFILPALVIGALMLGVGSVVARNYAQGTATEILSVLSETEGEVGMATANLLPTVAAALGVFLVMLFAAGVLLSRRPVLELLQGGRARRRTLSDRIDRYILRKKDVGGEESGEVGKFEGRELEDAPRGSVSMTVPTMRYVMRQILRTPFKTALVVLIAAGFVFALGWMRFTVDYSIAEADRIYDSTVVEGEIVKRNTLMGTNFSGIIADKTVEKLNESDFVENLYLEATQTRNIIAYDDPNSGPYSWRNPDAIEFDMSRAVLLPTFIATNNYEKFVEEYGIEVKFSMFQSSFEDSDAEMLSYCPVILPDETFAQIGLRMGDIVHVGYTSEGGGIYSGGMVIAGTYSGDISIEEGGYPCIIPLNWMKSDAERMHLPMRYSVAEFTIDTSKNRELDTFREGMGAIVESPDAGKLELSLLLWDEELKQVVKPLEQNVRLMSVLYPVTAVLSVIIAAGIAALLVMQAAHETALLRAVGLKRRRVLVMNTVQMAIPCLVGIIVGFAAVLILRNDSTSALGVGAICAAAYLAGAVMGAMAASLAVLKRRPMQLLQINE